MANIPTPRSFNQIVGDMLDTILSRLGLRGIRQGSPVLAIVEAAAQSDLRSSQDIFDMVNATSLDRVKGVALERIGLDEDLPKLAESPSSGVVTVTDTSFVKISSKVYQGQPAPIVGSSQVFVTDASSFPATGAVYIGRGTTNYEGPLAYSAKTNSGTYWTLTLTDNTRKFHNLGESIVLAQGGNRLITAGTIVQTPQGNASDAIQFSVLYTATLPDGETSVSSIVVTAKRSGVIGNVSAKAINSFVTSPFTGASVTNPLPFSNGQSAEDDNSYRERIRAVRQSRSKGTALAIKTSVQGITATDENKRVTSSSIVTREGFPTTLYIDDGTGYEEQNKGIAIEPVLDRATGGEQYFQISAARPLTKASLVTTIAAPFKLTSSSKLAMKVGGVTYTHTFDSAGFRNVANATAYEVAASINGDPTLGFSATTAQAGTKVRVFSKTDTNEDIEVAVPTGIDANPALLFPAGKVDTMRLYKSDRLLSKDGKIATLVSNPLSSWGVLVSGETLTLAIDSTSAVTYTFTDADFINAKTGYTTLGRNSIAAWVSVINAKVPGITASESAGLISISSNVGRTSRAKLQITGGTLVTKQMFNAGTDAGLDRDYTLDRNTGQIRLESVLAVDETLSAGTINTRAFIESKTLGAVLLASQADLYFVVDGQAKVIPTSLTAGTIISVTNYNPTPNPTWGERLRYAASTGSPFTNVLAGDWAIITDTGFNQAASRGLWRVAYVDPSFTYFEVEKAAAIADLNCTLAAADGIVFVRTPAQVQKVSIAAATYTASNFVTEINTKLVGAKAEVYQTNKFRVRTSSFTSGGDVALVAANTQGKLLLLPIADAVLNTTAHLASVESGNYETGTPFFVANRVVSALDSDTITVQSTLGLSPENWFVFLRDFADPDISPTYRSRWGTSAGRTSAIESFVTSTQANLRTAAILEFVPEDRLYIAAPYSIGPQNDLVVVADQDESGKRFSIPLWRKLKPANGNYGASNAFKDADNGNASLTAAFGLSFDFTDFALYMAARVKTHDTDSTRRLLWRYKRLGPDGNKARLKYVYPTAPSSSLAVTLDILTNGTTDISIALPSGAVRTVNLRTTTKIGLRATSTSGGREILTYILGYFVPSATRTANVTTLTLSLPSGIDTVTDHGLQINDTFYLASSSGSFTSGPKVITGRTASAISYADVAANATAVNIGTVSRDVAEATLTGSSAVIGDIFTIGSNAGFTTSGFKSQTLRITSLGAQFIMGYVTNGPTVQATPSWENLSVPAAFQIYPLAGNTATSIKNSVNALDAKCPVTATVVTTGTGSINLDTSDENSDSTFWYNLVDGVNWVKSITYPPLLANDYSFTFKNPIDSSLATNSDWALEDVRIVPLSAKAIALWLNSQAVSGISGSCFVETSTKASKLQIASRTAGSSGAVQVQGGSANSGAATVSGGASVAASAYAVVSVPKSDADTFFAGMWLACDNTQPMPKSILTAGTAVSSIGSTGIFTVTTPIWTYANTSLSPILAKTWRTEKQGKFVAYAYSKAVYGALSAGADTGVKEGDWVRVNANGGTINSLNEGIFRVIRTYADSNTLTFWVENANVVEGDGTTDVAFYTYDSLMPGDTLAISTPILGAGNQAVLTVEFSGGSTSGTQFSSATTFKVSQATQALVGPVTLGTSVALIKTIEAHPSRLIKQIKTISPNQDDVGFLDIKFETSAGSGLLSNSAGTVLSPLDRLGFSNDIAVGIDGYQHSTGLIGEANRVVYGDSRDPASYPGVVAAGANINISGPLVKRVSVALSLRIRSGVSSADIADRVRSAVASVVNSAGVGEAIAISDLVAAATKVNGVLAVSVLSPSYSATSDLIPVQPFEKSLVLNLEQDVTVSFAGE